MAERAATLRAAEHGGRDAKKWSTGKGGGATKGMVSCHIAVVAVVARRVPRPHRCLIVQTARIVQHAHYWRCVRKQEQLGGMYSRPCSPSPC